MGSSKKETRILGGGWKKTLYFTPTSENGRYNLTYIFNWIETTHPYTPQKFNMDTKNGHISKESSFPNHNFLGGSFKYFVFSPLFGEDSHFN